MDRISNLSDDLLSEILSYLPVRDMVSASAVSHRWLHLWTLARRLDLRCAGTGLSCFDTTHIISNILRSHSAGTNNLLLDSCLVSLHDNMGSPNINLMCAFFHQKRLAKLHISSCNFKQFNLQSEFFSLSSLEELVIEYLRVEEGTDFSHLHRLRFLHLYCVEFMADMSAAVRSLPCLERLGCILGKSYGSSEVKIVSQSLKQLDIEITSLVSLEIYAPALEDLTVDVPSGVLVLDAPSLVSFRALSDYTTEYICKKLPLYHAANLPVSISNLKHEAEQYFRSCFLNYSSKCFNVSAKSLSSLKELHIESLEVDSGRDFSSLRSLRFLYLRDVDFLGDFSAVTKSLPRLERLEISSKYGCRELKISSQSLKQLDIGTVNPKSLEIYAPSLEILVTSVSRIGFALHAPLLAALKLTSRCKQTAELLEVLSGVYQRGDISRFMIDHALIQNLRKLSVHLNLNDIRQVIVLGCAMKECQLLQDLSITVKQEFISTDRLCLPYDNTEYWDNQRLCEFGGISRHLKRILIKDFTGETLELAFAKFVVAMGAVLKKLVISHRCCRKHLEDIMNAPWRASPYLDIVAVQSQGSKGSRSYIKDDGEAIFMDWN